MTPYERASKRWVRCYCQVCERYHKKMIFWTGNGVPRIRCKSCQNIQNTFPKNNRFDYMDSDRRCMP